MDTPINDTLLTRYLACEVTPAEKALVDNWLDQHADNCIYLETLHEVWQLSAAREILDMNMDEKWAQFRQSTKRRTYPAKTITILAAAAAVCLLIALNWQWLTQQPNTRMATPGNINANNKLHHEINNTGKEQQIVLPDSTTVLLATRSALTWQEPFDRNISMNGKALFNVSRKAQHPFIVTSGEISTTVLGTSFEVDARHIIAVRLFDGKVMISSSNLQRMKNKVYLVPGQEFIYGSQIIIRSFGQPAPAASMNYQPAEDPYIPNGDESNWYMFNNQSLGQVLRQLSVLYKVRIIYDSKDIRNIYFTARYERTESLADILQRIATLNNLKITNNDSVIIISK